MDSMADEVIALSYSSYLLIEEAYEVEEGQ